MLNDNCLKLTYKIDGEDFSTAGEAASEVKKVLTQMGIKPEIVRKVAIAMYEAEINAVIHANGGVAYVRIDNNMVRIRICDKGPGIPDVDLAMQPGYSTAPDSIREMGFGAGMGLPNIKSYTDDMKIITKTNEGTELIFDVYLK